MASKNKTGKLGLNLWEGTDRPQRGDFNSDNLIVDEALGSHIENEEIHLTAVEKTRVRRPIQTLGYQGDGEATQTMTLESVPTGVVVYCHGKPIQYYDSAAGCTKIYSSVAFYGAGSTVGIELTGKVLTFKQDSAPQNGVQSCMNESGRQYKVIVIR